MEFMTLNKLFKDLRFKPVVDRSDKGSPEIINLAQAKKLIENMAGIYGLFGSPTMIDLKFSELQVYAIKRLRYLLKNERDYDPQGAGDHFQY